MKTLREHIRKILKEQFEVPVRLKRRLKFVDDTVDYFMIGTYIPDRVCDYKDGEELLNVVGEAVIERMYYNYFSDIDDNSEEWSRIYYGMVEYIEKKYGDEIKEYYHINCGD